MTQLRYINWSNLVKKAGDLYTAKRRIVNKGLIKDLTNKAIELNDIIERIKEDLGIKSKRLF